MSSSQNKTVFLGLSYGTACHRLRKNIMFRLVCECKRDICYVCGEKIECVDDFSIEHIQPWEGRDVDLFWDLSNIAFSHRQCNRPHDKKGGLKTTVQESTIRCHSCKEEKPFSEFGVRSNVKRHYDFECKHCKSQRNKLRSRKKT